MTTDYNLHKLGWKSFEDLCIAVAEECLKRPVQSFLSSKDGGRDGAFVGQWDGPSDSGTSVIQCKFTSIPHISLSPSLLKDEREKVSRLSAKGLAKDYIILTNHSVSGTAEEKIKEIFCEAGAENCRVFGNNWIVGQIQQSPRLRMMVPRLYGLGDLGNILDDRAYEQAKMILSAWGDDLHRFVVTDAHRRSVKAISEHNFVLLLGAPAAGKSTIGASLAVGAADLWGSLTIRITSPADLQAHINPNERQFFWVDDAWGSTQYQRHTIEAWNQVLPFMRAAIQRGSQFLLTSRDYIWKSAKRDLKTQALPVLERSKVIVNVQDLTPNERAQILYNHLKLGDQPKSFRSEVKSNLASVAESPNFLPEVARRLGSSFFTGELKLEKDAVVKFFEQPVQFLMDTIQNLSLDCLAAIALVFLNGGRIASPVDDGSELQLATKLFGASEVSVRNALKSLDGSLLLLASDRNGLFWTYKHPTIGDAFARFIANDSGLVELYLQGAKPEFILKEVVCASVQLRGAPVCVPKNLYGLLVKRISQQSGYSLSRFLSYRADRELAGALLKARPDLMDRLASFSAPISEDMGSLFLTRLFKLKLLPEEGRQNFFKCVRQAALEEADASFLEGSDIRSVFSEEEIDSLLQEVETHVLKRISNILSASGMIGVRTTIRKNTLNHSRVQFELLPKK